MRKGRLLLAGAVLCYALLYAQVYGRIGLGPRTVPQPPVVVCENGEDIDAYDEADPYLLVAYQCRNLGTGQPVIVKIID